MAQVIPQVFIALVMGFAARVLLSNSKRNPLGEDTTSALSKRGSRVPYIIGTEKVGSVVGFIGDFHVNKEKGGGGKGGRGKQDVYYETGWHHLTTGPGISLEEILENGKVIFAGPISPSSVPSGTEVNIGSGQTFIPWWGETNQPINTEMETKTGVRSRWPHLCSIWWKNKRLGTSHVWPLLEYVIETDIVSTLLTRTPNVIESPSIPAPTSHQIYRIVGPDNTVWVPGNATSFYTSDIRVLITGTGFPALDDDDTRRVVWSKFRATGGSFPSTIGPATEIKLTPGFSGFAEGLYTGEIRPSLRSRRRRNPAHILAQLLFEPPPHGTALPKEWFDLESLEVVAERLEAEGILGRLAMRGDDKIEDAVGKIMLDTMCMIFLDTRTGLYTFKLLRERAGPAPFFSADFFHERIPETTVPVRGRSVARGIYSYADRDFNFETATVGGIDDDGAFHRLDNVDAEVSEMAIPIDVNAASVIAELRSQGDLGEGAAATMEMMRGARELVPSSQIEVAGILERILVSSVTFKQGENAVKIDAISDYFSARLSSFSHGQGFPDQPESLPPASPLIAAILEIPAYLTGGLQVVGVPLVRAHSQIQHHELWISGTGSSYTHAGRQTQVQTGGVLAESLPADTDYLLDSGPLFEALGVDLQGRVLDLSGNSPEWRLGRQVLLINDEILFLDGVVAEGGSWRLGRILRARYDTRRQEHSAGDPIFIFESGELFPIQDVLLYPGAELFVKPQAVGNGSVPLEDIEPLQKTLIGKGVAPLAPVGLRVRGSSLPIWCRAFDTGDDLELRWAWQSFTTPNTGAGMQPSGNPTGPGSVQGEFRVEFRTAAGTLRSSYLTSAVVFTLSNAQLVSDFTSEPSSLRVRVREILGGQESTHCEALVVRI